MGYKEMPDAVKVPGLKPVAKLVLVAITGYANREKGCTMWHSSSTVANELGVSKKAVLAAYKTLEGLGLITRKKQNHVTPSGNVRRGSDIITVHFDRIKALADGQTDGKSEGGGNHSSPGVVNTGNQGGDESSPHKKELNKEPEQVKESATCTADASHGDFKERFKRSPDYAAIMGMIAAAGHWRSAGDEDSYRSAHDQLFDALEEVLGIPEDYRYQWSISKFCTDPYEAGMKFWTLMSVAAEDGYPPKWDGTNHGLKNPYPNNHRLRKAAAAALTA